MEKEVKARDHTRQKITRDGLVETTGMESVRVSKRISEADFKKETYANLMQDTTLPTKKSGKKQKQKRLQTEAKKRQRESVREGKMQFSEDETEGKDEPLFDAAGKKLVQPILYHIHREIREDDGDNAAVKAVHSTELSGEGAYRFERSRRANKQRKLYNRQHKLKEKSIKNGFELHYQERLQKETSMQEKGKIQKFIQKKRLKREYIKAYRSEKYGTKATVQGFGFLKDTGKKAVTFMSRNKGVIASVSVLLLLLLLLTSGLSSCTAVFTNTVSYTMASSYIAEPEEIEKAEVYYTNLESNLQIEINRMEAMYPGKDEYRYKIGAIEHDPHILISYLTAKYEDFSFLQVKDELDELFEAQYGVEVEETTDTVEETKTVQVGESLGSVVTSGYCNCSICCGQWSGGPTASGVMPTANHTLAVDATNPFVPIGTKVVMNGREYTVEDTGAFARYGVQFDVYYGSHGEASAHGHQTWECYLAEGNANTVQVTTTKTIDVLNVSMTAKTLRSVILSRMDEEEKEMYDLVYSTRGNLQIYETPIDLNWYNFISRYYGYSVNNDSGGKEMHQGLEINVTEGTAVESSMNGTVVGQGYDENYGNYVITRDKKGYEITYAHLQNITVANGEAVTTDTVIGVTGSTGSATGSQLYLELRKDGTYYNPIFYIESGAGGISGGGASYDDETVQKLFEEAEKYLGYPYVWGGSSPETSFDCSGFVCWVYTNSGVWNLPRTTAQGIYNQCTPIDPSEAQAGDIIFFTGTYAAGEPVTHVGIYAGDGMMIHCGDPIQYASINSPYWQQHFYGFGRPGN